jgi:hypothetical protein
MSVDPLARYPMFLPPAVSAGPSTKQQLVVTRRVWRGWCYGWKDVSMSTIKPVIAAMI